MRRLYVVVTGAMTLSLAACAPSSSPVSTPVQSLAPVPTPPYQCIPEAGGAPSACTETQRQEMLATEALYSEAEGVYRRLFAQHSRMFEEGREVGDEASELATGEAADTLREAHEGGVRFEGGKAELVWVKRLPGRARGGSTVALEACIDTSQVDLLQGGVHLGRGGPALERAYFSPVDGALRISHVESRSVESC